MYITLDQIPTTALIKWIDTQWYYLPEAITTNDQMNWMFTMKELICKLNNRNFSVKITAIPTGE